MRTQPKRGGGFTVISTLFGIAIFTTVSMTIFSAIFTLIRGSNTYREMTVISSLADQYLEYARNLPYSQIGTTNGNPSGSLPDYPNAATTTVNKTQYQIYYEVTYTDDPADGTILLGTDPAPNDYKQVKLNIKNVSTGTVAPFVTNIVPRGLESLANGGALFIKVFDAVGQPVSGATVSIINTALTPNINLTRTTDSAGNWVEVGLPNSVTSYHVVVTKNGYSSDQTYPVSVGNPSPTKPDATISNGQVTQISFSIDLLSTLTYNLVNETCGPISGVGLQMQGSKLIGTPSVLKFDNTYSSDVNGQIIIPSLEWDNYVPAITTLSYIVYGSSPIQQISILPGTNQQSTLILGPATANSLLVIVKDASNGNPIENASVQLRSVSPAYDTTKFTEGSIWSQDAWTGGSGQGTFTISDRYFADNGDVDVVTLPTALRLASYSGGYVTPGTLESSTFDTGTASTSYTTLSWSPASQNASTTLQFQIATNNDNATWNYLGPDGTASTYYTVPGTTISAATANTRYVRYKAFLGTESTTTTPVLSSINLNYVAGCAAPGQAMFAGLPAGTSYEIIISLAGYTTQTISNVTISGYNSLQVSL